MIGPWPIKIAFHGWPCVKVPPVGSLISYDGKIYETVAPLNPKDTAHVWFRKDGLSATSTIPKFCRLILRGDDPLL